MWLQEQHGLGCTHKTGEVACRLQFQCLKKIWNPKLAFEPNP
jgi:hypothetical protein